MPTFKMIRARAVKRKGGADVIAKLLPRVDSPEALAVLADDRVLSEMTRRIFCAGFVWGVIDAKWPGFEEAFLGFSPQRLLFQPDDFWIERASDTRIVRNGQKIMSVKANAQFVADVAKEHGSFGRLLSAWPANDQVGLLDLMAKRGSRLGGMTGQYFLRFIGKDCFILSRDVITCLQDAGVDIAPAASSKKDLAEIQACFNAWHDETGLPYTHLSRICAMSIGENHPVEKMMEYGDEP
ncbi:DNA-3-methyladenine glycosylase I [Methylovirgula sp. 4M-Z18]|uniref:DNA-3-methyladenine glycosylase I n=1 Tax=Methylovirgula sp. 4M-Z18 TaxID=2293567 RepID=UPI000E2EEB5F|nr:DNA-3-methyladenine glycosylase I [Methylovirgula sp. 4M-Z18]RFB75614.1 DNA-3-methyladenine glycosylase I [Methylovirgula sp. 4M-Z18]